MEPTTDTPIDMRVQRKERNRVNPDETPGGISRATEELSPQQEGAIVALLSDPGLMGAAKAAGVGKATLWRWMQKPAFREAYRRAPRGCRAGQGTAATGFRGGRGGPT